MIRYCHLFIYAFIHVMVSSYSTSSVCLQASIMSGRTIGWLQTVFTCISQIYSGKQMHLVLYILLKILPCTTLCTICIVDKHNYLFRCTVYKFEFFNFYSNAYVYFILQIKKNVLQTFPDYRQSSVGR